MNASEINIDGLHTVVDISQWRRIVVCDTNQNHVDRVSDILVEFDIAELLSGNNVVGSGRF